MAVLGYLAIAFKAWMFVDALRRRASLIWYVVVLALPLGDWVYFFVVKMRDYGVRQGVAPSSEAPEPGKSVVTQLERLVEESPSFHNRTRLAWALLDEGQAERAEHYFRLGLETHSGDREATFGLGLCQVEQEDYGAAVATLAPLVEKSFAYEDYDAALALADALHRDGREADALALLEQIVRQSHRIEHLVALARYQVRSDQRTGARATLDRAIADFEAQPDFLRRRNGAIATEARQMLRTLDED